jgi:hypothetical protein
MTSESHRPAATADAWPAVARKRRDAHGPVGAQRAALRERAVKAARKAGRTKPVGECYEVQILERLAQILELSRAEKLAVRVEDDVVRYAGRHPTLRLHEPAGEGTELVVVTGPDDGDLCHLLAPCAECGEPVPSCEFATLAALGAALLWRGVASLFPARRVAFSRIAAASAPHAEDCPYARSEQRASNYIAKLHRQMLKCSMQGPGGSPPRPTGPCLLGRWRNCVARRPSTAEVHGSNPWRSTGPVPPPAPCRLLPGRHRATSARCLPREKRDGPCLLLTGRLWPINILRTRQSRRLLMLTVDPPGDPSPAPGGPVLAAHAVTLAGPGHDLDRARRTYVVEAADPESARALAEPNR